MRFTLITEGVSENKIIKNIIAKFFKDREPFFRDAQPQILNDKQETIGGWSEVLKYCTRTADLNEIFNNTDYLVIQIDTDQCQQHPFNINHSKPDNILKSVEELHFDVVEKLKGLINPKLLEIHGNKILFAVCVHTIECWLLPIYSINHKAATTTCLGKLNVELKKKAIATLPTQDKNSFTSIRTYETILKNWKKKQDIIDSSQHNAGFNRFVESLKVVESAIG